MKIRKTFLAILLLGCAQGAAAADPPLGHLTGEDRSALESLALYDVATRTAILEASGEPDLLRELGKLREKASATLRKILSPYPREVQQRLWDMTRYPELVAEIAGGKRKTAASLQKIVSTYPEEIRSTAVRTGLEQPKVLVSIDKLNRKYDAVFDKRLAPLNDRVRRAFRHILRRPEALALLLEHPYLTGSVGDAYAADPGAVTAELDALHVEMTARQAESERVWAESLAADPEARRELEASAEEFARDTGREFERPRTTQTIVQVAPYSWWYGYPYWYSTAAYYDPYVYWYPYPTWWYCGYSYGPGATVVVVRPPSYSFVHWYFGAPRRVARYPHLGDRFVRHANRGPRRDDAIGTSVRRFERRTEDRLPSGWLRDDENRPKRLREFGELEGRIEGERKTRPKLTRQELLREHKKDFPELTRKRETGARNPGATPITRDPQKPGGHTQTVQPGPASRQEGRERVGSRPGPSGARPTGIRPTQRPPGGGVGRHRAGWENLRGSSGRMETPRTPEPPAGSGRTPSEGGDRRR